MLSHHRARRARPSVIAAAAVALLAPVALAGCQAGSALVGRSSSPSGSATAAATPAPEQVVFTANVRRGARSVPVDTRLTVTAQRGTIRNVRVTSAEGDIAGKVSADHTTWTADTLLEPGTAYTVVASGTGESGQRTTRMRFSTEDLGLDRQTYASIAPLDGETVGVGMPVIVTFDVPVTDKAAFEKRMKVTSRPAQPGAWHWLSDTEAHWRPKTYWQAGTEVDVDVAVNSIPAGGGVYGQEDRRVSFTVGDAHVYKVDAQAHAMKVFSNGRLLRTIPITTGKDGFTTRSGVKVIIEKFAQKRMNSETVGIARNNPEYYDIDDVKWAMRLTYSGEFIHAAPWSVGSQGSANVSHGCTGMSTANAAWLYAMSRRGDVVEYVGTDRPMTFDNGYGDWNVGFAEYRQGSALS